MTMHGSGTANLPALYVASKDRKQRASISSPEDTPLIIPNVNAGIIYDVDLFASKNLHD